LVESAYADPRASAEKAFRTEYVESSDVVSKVLGPDRREVLLVQKRSDSAFSGHIGVGRTPNLDVSIPRTGVSKFHAYFSPAGEGFQLTDKDSTNGTFVGGVRLTPGMAVKLTDGVEIQFANHAFLFMMPSRFFELLRSLAA
jgi:pSer/pThr/pTyr-binding forkhead associated (FHA) protein